MTEFRHGREFGKGQFLGEKGDLFLKKPLEVQTTEMGWSHGCPVLPSVIDRYAAQWAETHQPSTKLEARLKGLEKTRQRYAECNFVFGIVRETARKHNPDLYEELISPIKRNDDEPVGHYNSEYAPKNFQTEIPPLITPTGYAIPRVIIEEMGWGDQRKRNPTRILKALNLIEEKVSQSKDSIELAVNLAESVSKWDADPKVVLSHLLSRSLLEEENTRQMYQMLYDQVKKSAPTLIRVYNKLSSEDKAKLDIIEFTN